MKLNIINVPRLASNRLTKIALSGLLMTSQIQGYCIAQGLPNGVDLRYDTLRNKPERNLSTPGNEFGDSHSLENGALSFNVVDVSIPGNNSLPVEFRRSLRLTEPRGKYGYPNTSLADWEIDLPKITASYDAQAG